MAPKDNAPNDNKAAVKACSDQYHADIEACEQLPEKGDYINERSVCVDAVIARYKNCIGKAVALVPAQPGGQQMAPMKDSVT